MIIWIKYSLCIAYLSDIDKNPFTDKVTECECPFSANPVITWLTKVLCYIDAKLTEVLKQQLPRHTQYDKIS